MLLNSVGPSEARRLWDEGSLTWAEYEALVFKEATPDTFPDWVGWLPDEIGEAFLSRVHDLSRTNPEDLFSVQGGRYNLPREEDTLEDKIELVERAKLLVSSLFS